MATILVVEDSPVSLRLLDGMLRREGHTVVLASSGREAILQLAHENIDLVIADLIMPEIDGIALLRHIRSHESLEQLPLVMLTASGQEQNRIDARNAGANGFLTKPTSSRELSETIRNILS